MRQRLPCALPLLLVLQHISRLNSNRLLPTCLTYELAVQLGFVVCAVIGGVVLYKVFQGSSVEGAIRDTKGSLKGGFKEAKGSARVCFVLLFQLRALCCSAYKSLCPHVLQGTINEAKRA